MQTTSSLLMVRPAHFGFNAETAVSNAFQQQLPGHSPAEIRQKALLEFDGFVALLRENGIRVVVADDTVDPEKPDAVFPNNWISLHRDGRVALFPLQAPSRRLERRTEIIDLLSQAYAVLEVVDFSAHEKEHRYLEGTGSLILDHDNRLAYACLSPRTDAGLLEAFCDRFGYQPVSFHAYDQRGVLVYHTNVVLCIGRHFAVLCTQTIRDAAEKVRVIHHLTHTGHELIDITLDQLAHYAGNMLEVHNQAGQPYVVLSEQALQSLQPHQVQALEKYARILAPPLYTIEHLGGGSARCMLAEIFLPVKP
jgi:hypothetical protein